MALLCVDMEIAHITFGMCDESLAATPRMEIIDVPFVDLDIQPSRIDVLSTNRAERVFRSGRHCPTGGGEFVGRGVYPDAWFRAMHEGPR